MLLGYAIEMYLKAGLTKVYFGCSEEMFDRDVRKRFGHELIEIANEIAFELSPQDRADFSTLQDMILFGARYPIKEHMAGSYIRQKAKRLWQVWNRPEFTRMRLLAIRVRKHAARIDMDSYDAAHFQSHQIDSDGYLAFRCGGHLPPRITYRLSSEQRALGDTKLSDIRKLVEENSLFLPLSFWDYSLIQEDRSYPDGKFRTVVLQRPQHPAPRVSEVFPGGPSS